MRYRTKSDPGHPTVGTALLKCKYEYLWPTYLKEDRVLYCNATGTGGRSDESCLDEVHKKHFGHYESGGPLDIRRTVYKADPVSIQHGFNDGLRRFGLGGTIYPTFYGIGAMPPGLSNLPLSGMSAAASYGAEAWNRFKPGKPQFQLSVALAELRDMPGMLQKRAYAHRNLGKHYLSAQFGWLPFVSDLRKLFQTQKLLERTFKNIQNMNGKWVKRSGTVKSDTWAGYAGKWSYAGYIPCFDPIPWADVCDLSKLRCEGQMTESERVWFSGRFRYYIPDLDVKLKDTKWKANVARRIMGLTITPADAWEAVPWSWLIDYFSNAGQILSNLSSGYIDDVVAKYAYVMRSRITEISQTSYGQLSHGGHPFQGTVSCKWETKARATANPFGFTTSADLSGRQLAILAALGLSRS